MMMELFRWKNENSPKYVDPYEKYISIAKINKSNVLTHHYRTGFEKVNRIC
jgi:hypothetical protein